MLLQGIRDQAQGWIAWVIVILISIPFALWGIQEYLGGGNQVVVAKVNDQELDKYTLDFQVSNQIQRLRSFGAEFDFSSMEKQIKQSTLERMIDEEILFQTALNQQLRVGDGLLQARIHSIQGFQQNGQFSKTLYEQRIRAQYPSAVAFEQEMRRNLAISQLQDGLSRSSFFSAAEKKAYQQLDQQQRLVSYVLLAAEQFKPTIEISEQDIQTYYDEHQSQYFTEEQVAIDYAVLDKSQLATQIDIDEGLLQQRYEQQKSQYTTSAQWQASHILIPTEADMEAAKKQADSLLERVKAGEDFAKLAKEFSKDPISAEKGGDLGFFGTGQMVAPFEAAVKTLKVDEVSELVESRFGFHIIKLTGIKPEHTKAFAEVETELRTQIQNEEAQTRFEALTDEFSNLAFEQPDSLEPLLNSLGLEKQSSELFTRSSEKQGILAEPKVIEAAFSTPVLQDAQNSEVLTLEDGRYLVLRAKQHEKSQAQALDTVKEQITEHLRTEKSQKQAAELGEQLLSAIRQQEDGQSVLTAHELGWEKPQWLTRQGNEISLPQLRDAAFKMGNIKEQEALYQGITLNNGDYAVFVVLDIKNPEPHQDAGDKTQFVQQENAYGQTEFQAFLSGLKEQSEIKVYSSRL